MERFTTAVRLAIKEKNWYSALYLSLTLPDVCASLISVNGSTGCAKYAAWFDSNLSKKYTHQIGPDKVSTVFLSGHDCYALRCALFHNGISDIAGQRAQKVRNVLTKFHFTVHGCHMNKFGSIIQLDVATFCGDVCEAVDDWVQSFRKADPSAGEKLASILTIQSGPTSLGLITFGAPPES